MRAVLLLSLVNLHIYSCNYFQVTSASLVDQIEHGKGTGKTENIAKAVAAKMALESLGWLGMSFCALSTAFCRFNLLPAPEYVNMLNNNCQKARKAVTYTGQREGPQHNETWTETVFGKLSHL